MSWGEATCAWFGNCPYMPTWDTCTTKCPKYKKNEIKPIQKVQAYVSLVDSILIAHKLDLPVNRRIL